MGLDYSFVIVADASDYATVLSAFAARLAERSRRLFPVELEPGFGGGRITLPRAVVESPR